MNGQSRDKDIDRRRDDGDHDTHRGPQDKFTSYTLLNTSRKKIL